MKFRISLFLLFFVFACNLKSSENIKIVKIDLASLNEDDLSNTVNVYVDEHQKLAIRLENALPSMKYTVYLDEKKEILLPFGLSMNANAEDCEELFENEKLNMFYEIDENIIRVIMKNYRKKLKEECPKNDRNKYLDSLMKYTYRNAFEKGVEIDGDSLNLRIVRDPSKLDKEEHRWNIRLVKKRNNVSRASGRLVSRVKQKAESSNTIIEKSNWQLSYGFAFPILFANDEEYFITKSDSIPTMFEIKKKKDNQYINFIPSIFIHWNPNNSDELEWTYSVTGGIGFDMEKPIVFAGGSAIYHDKLNFNFGLVIHKLKKLNGKYYSGELINEILDENQLHEEFYRINPFIGLSFRF